MKYASIVIPGIAAAALITACAPAPKLTTAPAAPADPPKLEYVYYECRAVFRRLDGLPGVLTLIQRHHENGDIILKSVRYTRHLGIRNAPSNLVLQWPGESDWKHYVEGGRNFDWSKGTLTLHHHADVADTRDAKFRKEFPWKQVVVSRSDDTIIHYGDDIGRHIKLSHADMYLMSAYSNISSRNGFSASIDALLAYAGDLRTLRVYDVRRAGEHGKLFGNYGRLVADYDLNVSMIRKPVATIREKEAAWRQSIADYKTACERGEKYEGDDVITVTGEQAEAAVQP